MFGSPYRIAKAIADGRIRKLEDGVYSDTGEENELEIVITALKISCGPICGNVT